MAQRRVSYDPEEILKMSPREILDRLAGDANAMYAMGEIDKAVLRGLIGGRGALEPTPEQEERLREALLDVEALIARASSARRAIERLLSGE